MIDRFTTADEQTLLSQPTIKGKRKGIEAIRTFKKRSEVVALGNAAVTAVK